MSQEQANTANEAAAQPEPTTTEPEHFGIFVEDAPPAKPAKEAEAKPESDKKAEFEAAQQAQRELETARKALKEQQERVKAAEEGLNQYQAKAKEDPKGFLSGLGFDPLELAQRLVTDDPEPAKPPREVEALMERVNQLETQIKMREAKEVEERQIREAQEVVARQVEQFGSMLSQDKTPWLVALKEDGGEPVEQQLLQAAVIRYQQTGEVPDYQAMIEEAEAKVRAKYEKLVNRFAPAKPASPTKPAKTLTNQLTDEPAAVSVEQMDSDDRDAAFLKIMRESGWE